MAKKNKAQNPFANEIEALEFVLDVKPEEQKDNPYAIGGNRWYAFELLRNCQRQYRNAIQRLRVLPSTPEFEHFRRLREYYRHASSTIEHVISYLRKRKEFEPTSEKELKAKGR